MQSTSKTGNFTCTYASRSARSTHANHLPPHVNLPEICGFLQVILPLELVPILPQLTCKNACFRRQRLLQLQGKIACEKTHLQAKIPAVEGKTAIALRPIRLQIAN